MLSDFTGRCLIIALGLFLLSTQLVKAEDYYVAATGSGTGANAGSPASISALNTKLTNLTNKTLNVYFAAGTYNMPSALTFGSVANNSGANVTFMTLSGNKDVTFAASGTGYRFVDFVSAGVSGNAFSFTMRNLIVQGYTTGTNFIYVQAHSNVRFEGCDFLNNTVTGSRMFTAEAAYSLMSFYNCNFTNNQLTTNNEFIYSNGANSPLILQGCNFDNNYSGYSFLYNSTQAFNITSCTFKNSGSRNSPFIYSVGATSQLTITGSTFTSCQTGDYFIFDTDAASNAVITDCEFKQITAPTNLLLLSGNSTITNTKFTENTTTTRLIQAPTTGTTIKVIGSTFTSNKSTQTLLYADGTGLIISGSTFTGNEITTGGSSYGLVTNDIASKGSATIYDNYFTGNTITGASSTIFRNNGHDESLTNMYRNTFAGNTVSGTNGSVIRLESGSGTPTIYNNTFSNNIGTYSVYINTSNSTVVNNTIYNSKDLYINGTNAGTIVKNNLLLGGDKINPSTTTAGGYCSFNISDGRYYTGSIPSGGTTGGTAVNLTGYYDTNLVFYDPAKPPVHDLLSIEDSNHPILGKGNIAGIAGLLTTDQKGNLRPSLSPISIGAIDYITSIVTYNTNEIYTYRDIKGLTPLSIDLSSAVALPTGASLTNLNVTITGSPTNGTLTRSPNNNYTYIFTPKADIGDPTKPDPAIIDVISILNYTAAYTDPVLGTLTASNTLSLKVIDMTGKVAPGFIDEEMESCFGTMGNIDFSSSYRYNTGSTIGTARENRFVGFSIPLVGDLNNDGKPEIIALGDADAGQSANSIIIIDGLTGKQLTRFSLPVTLAQNYHPTPSSMALVNTGEDPQRGQIILAYQPSSSGAYAGKLVSYRIKSATDFTLEQYWISDYEYSTLSSSHNKPIPQILNFDGKGNPEVLVYNRIYDAHTGKLKMTLGTLPSTFTGRNVHRGGSSAGGGSSNDGNINYSYTYDMDLDGKYDYIAGGQIFYDLDLDAAASSPTIGVLNTHYKYTEISGIPDGRTGVADINGDGIPDVVVVTRISDSQIRVMAWNPDFLYLDAQGNIQERDEMDRTPYIMADVTLDVGRGTAGNNSYVYIGDIDGLKDHKTGKYLPEIAVLSGTLTNNSALMIHPNVANTFPETNASSFPVSGDGVIFAMTWDDDPAVTATNEKLKLSFVLEHRDRSTNTGFTMYDFDNDGMQEICYRDENTLRIIKASVPYVYNTYTVASNPDVILFSEAVRSYTGFELPVIADIDGDNSAEMIVMGNPADDGTPYWGYIYAVGNNGDKFSPALPVWNQFMYSPFKINSDLTVPTGLAPNPLIYKYKRARINDVGVREIIDTQLFNGTLIQATQYMEDDTDEGILFEPIVFFTDGYITGEKIEVGSTSYAKFKVGNKDYAKTSISTNTPIRVYKTSVVGSEWVSEKKTLLSLGVTAAIRGGQVSQELSIEIPDPYGIYYIRLGDDTENPSAPSPTWSYGQNSETGGNPALGIGPAKRYLRDCIWADNEVKVAKYVLNDDAYTIQEFANTGFVDIIANDIIPDDMASFTLSASDIVQQPQAGVLEFDSSIGAHGGVRYTHTGAVVLPDGIDQFVYEFTYNDPVLGTPVTRQATVYVYILQSIPNGFAACIGESDYDLTLRELPIDGVGIPEVNFHWYNSSDVEIAGNPQSLYTIASVSTNMQFKVRPEIISGPYMTVNFPKGHITFYAIPQDTKMTWTGAVNTNWNNPNNWTDNAGNAVGYSPRGCVDVTIPTEDGSNTPIKNYPWLYNEAYANDVKIESKAMLANTHHLTYNDASFEMKFDASERNRWVMYSAPFGRTYSGDFMFLDADNYPKKNAVYMSLFQTANPDNAANLAAKHQFSLTFSKIEQELTLGTGFILYIDDSKDSGVSSFKFPSSLNQYEYYYGKEWAAKPGVAPYSGVLNREATLPVVGTRTANNRFITEMAPSADAKGAFDMAMTNDIAGSNIIMVTNPFNAYLKVDQFLTENASVLEQAYMVWDGSEQAGFIEYLKDRTVDDTYITTNGTTIAGQLISPYQSFFVVRKGSAAIPTSLKFKPEEMTVTSTASAPYPLKLVVEAAKAVRVKASYNNVVSYTAILRSDMPEQTPKLFFNNEDKAGIDIYTIVNGEAVSINALSDLSQEVPLGIRMTESGSVTLNLSGVNQIDGYEVYLKDGDSIIGLKDNDDYNIQIERPSDVTTPYFEVNNRLSLVFKSVK